MANYIFPIFEIVLGIGLLLHSLMDISDGEIVSFGLAWFIACGLFLDAIRRIEKIVAGKNMNSLRQRSVRIIKINHGVHYESAE